MENNLCVYYLYRDAGNNKRHGQVVLANPTGVSPETLRAALVAAFPNGQSFPDVVAFNPVALGWSSLFFVDHNLAGEDVSYHEVELIEAVNGELYDSRSVEDVFVRLERLEKGIPTIPLGVGYGR